MRLRIAVTREQFEPVTSTARNVAVIAGRRWGKTIGVCRPRAVRRCLEAKCGYMYITPTFSQLVDEYNKLSGLDEVRPYIRSQRQQPYYAIHYANGSEWSGRSFQKPGNIRSKGPDEVWLDEIQDIPEKAFWAVVGPLVKDRRGTIGMSGQLRGRNWYWRAYVMPGLVCRARLAGLSSVTEIVNWINGAVYADRPVVVDEDVDLALKVIGKRKITDYAAWIFPSHSGLMFQDEDGADEIDKDKAQMPLMIFEQEYLCIPTATESGVFRADDLQAARRGEAQSAPSGGRSYILAVDIGRVVDPCSIVVLDATEPRVVYEEVMPLGQRHEASAARVRDIRLRWNDAVTILDATGGGGGSAHRTDEYVKFYQELNPNARALVWNYSSKKQMVEALVLSIEKHELAIPAGLKELHRQLAAFTYKIKGSDRIYYEAPQGDHDDLVAALVMAWHGRQRGWHGSTSGIEYMPTV